MSRTWAVCVEVPAYYWYYVEAETREEAELTAEKLARDPNDCSGELEECDWQLAAVCQPAEPDDE